MDKFYAMFRTRLLWLLIVLVLLLAAECAFLTAPIALIPWCYLIIALGITCLLLKFQSAKGLKLITLGLFCIVGQFFLWSCFGYNISVFGYSFDMLWISLPAMYLLFMACFDENPVISCRILKGIMLCYMGLFALLICKLIAWFISLL